MAAAPKGMLVVFTDFPPGEDDAIDEWYTREHVKSRVVVDGFRWGKRYEAILGAPRYAAVYGTDDVSVLASRGYFEAGSNPDRAERENVPKFRGTRRTVCAVTASAGEGEGGVAGFLALSPEEGRRKELRAWIAGVALPGLAARRGVVAAHLWETDAGALAAGSRGFVPAAAGAVDWLLVWEGTRFEELRAARSSLLDEAELRARGAGPESDFGFYRLLFRLAH